MNSFNRWIRSKAGMATIASFIVITLVVAVVGQFAGWWGGPGTALPSVEQDCMPTCEENDGRMIHLVGSGESSFAGEATVVWVSVPEQYAAFTLSVFDGDSGKDPSGKINKTGGNWDSAIDEVTYILYADALRDGSTSKVVGQWSSNDMPDNAWYDIPIDNVQEAMDDAGDYRYRFEASMPANAFGDSTFKLKSQNAYLSFGLPSLPGKSFGIMGMLYGLNDAKIIYPEYASSGNLDVTTYNGGWEFQFYLPEGSTSIQFWNGDSDRGTSTLVELDTDDPNTVGKPDWASPAAVDERAAGKGAPPDDSSSKAYRRGPSIQFVVIGPDGNEIARDTNAGGTEEWEEFVISTDPNVGADVVVNSLPEGNYKLRIEGLDIDNALWLRTDLELFHLPPPPPPPPPCVPENSNLGGGYAIIALNPGSCQGQQNGLLFHGTSYTQLIGKAISNGCLRSVGTHDVLAAGVEYVGEYVEANDQVKIIPDPYKVSTPVSVNVAAPNCNDPAAHKMAGKDFTGNVTLEPGLYCITGDVTINAGDVVKGDDVTLYFIDGKLTINGGAMVQLSAPYAPGVNVSPALSNILFYVPEKLNKKGEADGQVVKINGGSDSYFSGTVYAPSSTVEFLGTSYTEGGQTTQIIGWDVRVGGTADLVLGYVGSTDPVCKIK